MPWKVTRPMDERIRFVARYLDGEKMVDLCREFGISRKTGYKFLERYDKFGPSGLLDQSKRPIRLARKTADEIERLVISLRLAHPTWGSRKLREKLLQRHSGLPIPVASTIGEILSRHGLIVDRKRRPIEERLRTPTGLTDGESPNEVWCCDFKGQFRLSNGQYCYPLTVTDHASRYIIGCEGLASTKVEPARAIFEELFDLYGLPSIIRSDNGVPFSARGFGGLSRLSAWWMSLGIRPERIQPGHPEQNGRHERMHRTLKDEATRPAAAHLLQQQEKFDAFREIYNKERPHEALGMKAPADCYSKSGRTLKEAQSYQDYPLHDQRRNVDMQGCIKIAGKRIFLGRGLGGSLLGLREIDTDLLQVALGPFDIGYIDLKEAKLLVDNPLVTELDDPNGINL